jgi:hypothetical protein
MRTLFENRDVLNQKLHLIKLLYEENVDYRILGNVQLAMMKMDLKE